MTVPTYGSECVDFYRATVRVGGVILPSMELTVTDPNQVTYIFTFTELELCMDPINSVAVAGVTDDVAGVEGSPAVTDIIDRFSKKTALKCQMLDGAVCNKQQQQKNTTELKSYWILLCSYLLCVA